MTKPRTEALFSRRQQQNSALDAQASWKSLLGFTSSPLDVSAAERSLQITKWFTLKVQTGYRLQVTGYFFGLEAMFKHCNSCVPGTKQATTTVTPSGWWFQSSWKILVSWEYHSKYMEKYNMFQTTNQPSIVSLLPYRIFDFTVFFSSMWVSFLGIKSYVKRKHINKLAKKKNLVHPFLPHPFLPYLFVFSVLSFYNNLWAVSRTWC